MFQFHYPSEYYIEEAIICIFISDSRRCKTSNHCGEEETSECCVRGLSGIVGDLWTDQGIPYWPAKSQVASLTQTTSWQNQSRGFPSRKFIPVCLCMGFSEALASFISYSQCPWKSQTKAIEITYSFLF